MAFLTLEGIVKRYGSFTAIDGLNLDVQRGEFVALLGPSGCGKTTTLQSIAGFVQPTEGRIVLDGRDITHVRPERRGLGIVFQSYALFPHMTVAQNISFGLEMRGVAKPERGRRILEALDLVRLGGLGERYPKALSGGQRQRVAIARALAIRPDLLLLDEPMSNLDAKLREEMHIELRAIQRELGITTILVTHDQVEAMTMSDRIAVMHKGRIVQIDTPFEAYERPHSPFASAFLGKTNAFAGAVRTRNARCCHVQVNDTVLHVPHEDRSLGHDVNVYIRPEKIRLTEVGKGRLKGRVRLRVFLGNLWLLAVESSFGMVHMTQPNLGTPPPQEHSEVGLDWSDEDLRVLDREVAHGQV
ncbi:ABC transporter ATP-binding protein [Pseudomonas fulva]|nr:ABC transporter ATP-binding protein [Pseudomonas fulva]MBF8780232.1 ABC transporter ATP-binding protein [Pseudomonas fulva]